MPTLDYTEFLHNVKQEYIEDFYQKTDTFIFKIKLPQSSHSCPACGAKTDRVKDYRIRKVNFGAVQGHKVMGEYRQRRYYCPNCHHAFSEDNPFVSRYAQLSKTNVQHLYVKLSESLSYTAIAKECNSSITTIIRYFSLLTMPKPKTLPGVIAIDEFKGNADGYKFQVILTNPDSGEILDILPKRDTQALMVYFGSFKRSIRNKVKYIVMDMSAQFKHIMQMLFPHAHIVCDRYHVCRLVDWAVERVRKREQHKLSKHSRMLKQNKRVLMKNPDNLTTEECIKLTEIFRVSDDLRLAYGLRLAFRKIFKVYGKQQIVKHITSWLKAVEDSKLLEFRNLLTSFPAWLPQLVNAFLLPYSNGYTEGCNNKIKVLKRISYGIRHFDRFRVRILLLSKKKRTNHKRDWFQMRIAG